MTRILLVEDNRGDARLFSELVSEVRNRPFEVTVVDTLAGARTAVRDHDIVFLDLSLPDTHGLPTINAMLEQTRKPIVVLTGNDDDRIALEAVAAGAQDYLTKGELTPNLIERTIRYALERRRAEEAASARARADELARRSALLSSVTSAVTASFDVSETLPQVAKLLVPTLADYCLIDLLRDGALVRIAYAAPDPEAHEILRVALEYSPGAQHPNSPALQAVATRQSVVVDALASLPDDRARGVGVQLGARLTMAVPLIARDRVVGALNLTMGPSGREFDHDLRRQAQEVADRIALGVDNASLYADAQRAIRGRDELLAVVSHDLRNPLGVVDLALTMLSEQPQVAASALPRAKRAVDKMLALIEDLLEVARIESGTFEVTPVALPANLLVEEAVELHKSLAQKRGIELEVTTTTQALAWVDRKRVGQALANLIGNALKHTPRGGTIGIGATAHEDGLVFSVEDTGEGIAPDHLAHIFDRYWQPRRRNDGVGLGLAIVKGIVDAHRGTIEVQSKVGRGTKFRISLPAAAAVAA